jgi:hypothetical protein
MTTQTTVEIDVLLEFRDYLRANYWFLFHRFKLVLGLLFFVGLFYPLLLVSRLASQRPTDNYWGFLIPLGVLVFMFAGTYFNTKKHMASNRALRERVHYVFSETGIESTAPSTSGRTAWQNVYEAHEAKTNFLIFISKNMMYVIPKRCFHDAEQMASFKRLLRSQLNAKAKWQ